MALRTSVLSQFQHTAARRRLLVPHSTYSHWCLVSTHSRPKAAAISRRKSTCSPSSFNTQPPEGGCLRHYLYPQTLPGFNTQPPEGGCQGSICPMHAWRGFNTQPPEGGCPHCCRAPARCSCFNTQPPEGGCILTNACVAWARPFQHTAARRRLRGGAHG